MREKRRKEKNRESAYYLMVLILVAVFASIFVSVMGYLNYRTSALELEESVIRQVGQEAVSGMETALSFGKSFENFFGVDAVFTSFSDQYEGPLPFIISEKGELLYCAETEDTEKKGWVEKTLQSREYKRFLADPGHKSGGTIKDGTLHACFSPIHDGDTIKGYFGCTYSERIFSEGFKPLIVRVLRETLIIVVLEAVMMIFFVMMLRKKIKDLLGEKTGRAVEKFLSVAIMAVGILILTGISLFSYRQDYHDRTVKSIRTSLRNLETNIKHVSDQGVDLREVEGLREYIEKHFISIEELKAVRISERISEVKNVQEESDLITFAFKSDESTGTILFLEAEISQDTINEKLGSVTMLLLSTMIILLIFVFEMNPLVDLLTKRREARHGKASFSEKEVSLALRFTGFLVATAEYMCVPYAAMMIRERGESLFGLSVGMTAALPLTLEGVAQMVAMLFLPKLVKKFNVRVVLVLSAILMIGCNLSAFFFGTAAAIIACRALAGIAYGGFKQVSNFLITKGYETETGRSENISQDNAGLLAGATCGAGLGAILSSCIGYGGTFAVSAVVFVSYLLVAFFLLPWKPLSSRSVRIEEQGKLSLRSVGKMLRSPEMLFYVIVVCIPLNIGVMLCVTLIPAICQTNGISSVMLSYCYIANGLAGIYVGPALVATAKKRFGIKVPIAFVFALAAVSIFILRIPPIVVMIIVSSMILGFLDGFGTPLVTDHFLDLKVVKNSVDESSALIFSVILTYVLLTFAPMVAELLLLPEKNGFSPMLLGAILYAAASVLLFISALGRRKKA